MGWKLRAVEEVGIGQDMAGVALRGLRHRRPERSDDVRDLPFDRL